MKPLPPATLIAYGALGLPLAFAALPLYIHLAPFYSGLISLSTLGVILLALRFVDAVIDPLIGTLFDRFPYPRILVALSLPLLGIGWIGVFTKPVALPTVPWLVVMLALTTVGYSLATVVHNTWGARLSSDPNQRARIFAAREGFGLIGVVLAAALPSVLATSLAEGMARMGWIFLILLISFATLTLSVTPVINSVARASGTMQILRSLKNPVFARFAPGYLLNAVAAAFPATLVIFFINDVLKLANYSGLFLVIYFLSGALGLPLWVWLAKRIGAFDAWLVSMVMSIVAFISVFWLGEGDLLGYGLVCLISGLTLGADLALPPTLVADMIAVDAHPQPGAYFGLMGFLSKLALAVAAGVALPLIEMWGYTPGSDHFVILTLTYALLPISMKLAALGWFWRMRPRFPFSDVPGRK
jgi:Na+/melibiose symporter-like transporter